MLANLELAKRVPSLVPHLPYVFMPLDAMIDDFMVRKAISRTHPLRAFLSAMIERVTVERYSEVQERHLSKDVLDYLITLGDGSALEKYLNFPVWAASKFGLARTLGMDKGKVGRLLDLGAGPGHFGLMARYMGVGYVGLDYTGGDAAFVHPTPAATHVYDDLFRAFALERVDAAITPYVPLAVPGRFDLVTCLMGIFPAYFSAGRATPWTTREWTFFLRDLVENVVTRDAFTVYFQIAPAYIAPVLDWLGPLCREMNHDRGVFVIDETIDLALLR